MNPLMEDYTLEEHRKDIARELDEIHLQELALKNKSHHPSLFSHSMQKLGQWLIVRGEKMVKRYEAPSNSTKSSKRKFAH